ncbi:MAG: hypothetical protein ACLFTH_02615 [Candidatus Woesearchaeota archaeon]
MVEQKELKTYFQRIEMYYADFDTKKLREHGTLVHDTEKGIFGVSDLKVIFEFFKKIGLSDTDVFVDLGSGDGRVVLVASLFSKAIGIEYDQELIAESAEAVKAMASEAEFYAKDYEAFDYSQATVLFSYADHPFTPTFIEKLKTEFNGLLYVYQGVFLPEGVLKGRTVWIGQTPLISYDFSG